MGLFSYFYPCNNHQELRKKTSARLLLLMTKSPHYSIYTRRLELFGKSIFSLLLYFVTDRHSGPGERLLYPKFQTDTLRYSVADRSLYTLFPTDIPIYTLGGRPLYPGSLTNTPMYSVAYRTWFTLSLTNIPGYSPCDRPLYPGLLTDTLGNSSFYTLLLIQDIYNCQLSTNHQSRPCHSE